jgi:molybdenum cofactor biosynthesis enzyme MoaA
MPDPLTPLGRARQAMVATGQWDASQSMGRRWPIGCLALEITQRCNLDCRACYLSEHSEAVKDLPLAEVFRRIDMIRARYGANTDVQVTGGDPTLRRRDELLAIVHRIRALGMRPSLLTNGIKASRALLVDLAAAGLVDVAFHVDMTQQRKGYRCEGDLNRLRRTYIERARGLPLSVFFNTTVFDGNFEELPEIVAFFVRHSDVVRLAAFHPQAQTGRGALGQRSPRITPASVIRQIERGAGAPLSFDTAHIGHSRCNRYAMGFVVNGRVYDVLDNKLLYARLVERTAGRHFDRQSRRRAVATFLGCLMRNPGVVAGGALWFAGKLWRMKRDLLAARGRVNKLSFMVHNFMDACALEKERLDACVFMVATKDGPMSMCLHNAVRDRFILEPVPLQTCDGEWYWDPLSGGLTRQRVPQGSPPAARGPRRRPAEMPLPRPESAN